MEWLKCIVCRKSEGCLINPSDRQNCHEIHENFLRLVDGFLEMQKLPATITISGQEDADELIKHSAKWYKSCRLKFSESKLQRAKERFKQNIEDSCPVERKSRRISSNVLPKTCVFCKKSDGTPHSCSTFNVDTNLRSMATKMQDSNLLTCISGGDLVATEAVYHSKCMLRYKFVFAPLSVKIII